MKWISYYVYYSILGFLFESICNIFIRSDYSSGILFGPFTPIYFFGFLIIVFLDKLLEKKENKKFKDLVYLVLSFIILSIVEYLGGKLCFLVLGHDKWNYNKYPLTIDKYVNVFVSLIWSIGSLIYKKYFMKRVNKVILNMPKKLTISLFILYILDNLFSIVNGF